MYYNNNKLQHYGVKGMRWEHRKVDPEDVNASIDTIGKALEDAPAKITGTDNISKELGDVIDVALGGKGDLSFEAKQLKFAVNTKVNKISKNVKERGRNMLIKMFGTSKKKTTITSLNTTVTVKELKRK